MDVHSSPDFQSLPLNTIDEIAALRAVVEGTAAETGERFFVALVEHLGAVLNTYGAWVTEYLPARRRLRAIAFKLGTQWMNGFEYPIDGTPCATTIDTLSLVHIPDRVLDLYPGDPDLRPHHAVSYLGVALQDVDGTILGHLAVLDQKPLPSDPRVVALFRIFAARAGAELQRLNAEKRLREREEKLMALVSSAMDAIVEVDLDLRVSLVNPAAEKLFECSVNSIVGRDFSSFLSEASLETVRGLLADLDARPPGHRYLWIPGGLQAQTEAGRPIPVEATLSRSDSQNAPFYTLILRDVNERLEAERKIRSLSSEAEYLRQEIEAVRGFDEIVGSSAAMRRVLRDIDEVADTDATVLILGETGTGKELVARAIHARSSRRSRPLIKLNCAAIPAGLIESELFGHEKGAFTGALQKREGRFALADRSTLFLDEVGELPLDLQVKLLRVLQEGEFEPVGSGQTRKVNVRVLAATNRDLLQEVRRGNFRADLYYRLNVFPIQVPPLRERGDDVVLLATAFGERFARRMRRSVAPFDVESLRRLKAYAWPGNVRELQNIIERAVITSRDGRLSLDRALPAEPDDTNEAREDRRAPVSDRIHTIDELEDFERRNLLRALEASGWKVAGEKGAAALLGMNPSTLSSRMRALGITRPAPK